MRYLKIVVFALTLFPIGLTAIFADEKPNPVVRPAINSGNDAEQVNVDSIKEKYWARGDETEVGVVQNRTFSKKGRVEFSLIGGVLYSDPFLSMQALGGTIGYHLTEYTSLHFVGYKEFVNPSSALQTFQTTLGATTNTNEPNYYLGGEAMGSLFYGKLSALGKSIIYYDFYMLGGAGATKTENGTYFTPSLGLGQRFYLNRIFSIRLDYRLTYYKETILEKVVPTMIGQSRGQRDNWNNVIMLGISIMPFGGEK